MAKVAYSADIQELRGKIGSNVFSRARSGATVRIRVSPRNPRSPAQASVRFNLAKAAAFYKNFNTSQVDLWENYANTLTWHDAVSGSPYAPTANMAFMSLAAKYLQINPAGSIPSAPPSVAFTGDVITVTAAGAVGKVTFTGSAANAANVKTELLLQPLKSRNRTPGPKAYRTKAFVAFVVGTLTADVTVPPGFYAPAYRFVNTLSGQDVPLVTLPVVQVT